MRKSSHFPCILSIPRSTCVRSTPCVHCVDHILLSYLRGSIFFFCGSSKLLDTENQIQKPRTFLICQEQSMHKAGVPNLAAGNGIQTSHRPHNTFHEKFISIVNMARKAPLDLAPAFFTRLLYQLSSHICPKFLDLLLT